MKCIMNLIFLIFCFRVVVTIQLLENGIIKKLNNLQNFNLYNKRIPNPVPNPFYLSDNRKYHPEFQNYQKPPKFNLLNYNNNYRPRNLPYSPLIPRSHQTPFVVPSRYNILDSYKTAPLIRPTEHLQTGKQKNLFDNLKPVYPIRNINFEDKLTRRLVELPSHVKDIISKPMIRNHYKSSQKKYMVIHPNGTVDDVDNLEPAVLEHLNYVLVKGADIFPINNEIPVQTSRQGNLLKLNQVVNQNEAPNYRIQVNHEESVNNIFENDDGSLIGFPNTVTDNSTPFKNTPTTIIEINPQFIKSSNDSVTITQPQGEAFIPSPANFSEDIIIQDLAKSHINSTNQNENTKKEKYVEKNKFIDQVPTIEGESVNVLNRSTILTNNTNVASLYSEHQHLFDEVHLPLETDNKFNIHDIPYRFNEGFHNETSKEFWGNTDTYTDNDSNRIAVNSAEIYKEGILPVLPMENPTEFVKDYDLLADQGIDESKSTTSVAWTVNSNNTKDNHEIKPSEINTISATSILRDITDATDNANPTTTDKQTAYFKIDRDFWKKLKNNEITFDVVYFFQVEEPVIEKGIKTIAYPNGTVVTYETVLEDNQPIVVKNIDAIDSEVLY